MHFINKIISFQILYLIFNTWGALIFFPSCFYSLFHFSCDKVSDNFVGKHGFYTPTIQEQSIKYLERYLIKCIKSEEFQYFCIIAVGTQFEAE